MGISILVPGVNWATRNLGKVTPTGSLRIKAIAVEGNPDVINSGMYVAVLFPSFTTQRGVSWSIVSGSSYATIDSNGVVTAKEGASASTVTIRATSTADPSVYDEKTISVTSATVVDYDYLEADGNSYFLVDGGNTFGDSFPAARVVIRTTFTTGNGYPYGSGYEATASATRVGVYKRIAGDIGVVAGASGFLGTSQNPVSGKVYKVEHIFSTAQNGTDGAIRVYDDEDNLIWSRTGSTRMYLNGDLAFFVYGHNQAGAGTTFTPEAGTYSANRLYGFEAYDAEDNKIMDIRRVTLDGTPALLDDITKKVYYNLGAGTVTPGND